MIETVTVGGLTHTVLHKWNNEPGPDGAHGAYMVLAHCSRTLYPRRDSVPLVVTLASVDTVNCSDCRDAYAPDEVVANVVPTTGTSGRCTKTACYNIGNGRDCWTVTHADGTRSFEWPDQETAETMAALPSRENVDRRNHMSWC